MLLLLPGQGLYLAANQASERRLPESSQQQQGAAQHCPDGSSPLPLAMCSQHCQQTDSSTGFSFYAPLKKKNVFPLITTGERSPKLQALPIKEPRDSRVHLSKGQKRTAEGKFGRGGRQAGRPQRLSSCQQSICLALNASVTQQASAALSQMGPTVRI